MHLQKADAFVRELSSVNFPLHSFSSFNSCPAFGGENFTWMSKWYGLALFLTYILNWEGGDIFPFPQI